MPLGDAVSMHSPMLRALSMGLLVSDFGCHKCHSEVLAHECLAALSEIDDVCGWTCVSRNFSKNGSKMM